MFTDLYCWIKKMRNIKCLVSVTWIWKTSKFSQAQFSLFPSKFASESQQAWLVHWQPIHIISHVWNIYQCERKMYKRSSKLSTISVWSHHLKGKGPLSEYHNFHLNPSPPFSTPRLEKQFFSFSDLRASSKCHPSTRWRPDQQFPSQQSLKRSRLMLKSIR